MQSFSPFSHPSEGKFSFPHILKLSFDMLLVSPSQEQDQLDVSTVLHELAAPRVILLGERSMPNTENCPSNGHI